MNPFQAFLHLLSDPNIAFILFTLGFYGLLFELIHPNFVTGILGGLGDHPRVHRLRQPAAQHRRAAADRARRSCCSCSRLTVTSHGLLAIGGIVCFVLGASALYTDAGHPTEPTSAVALARRSGATARPGRCWRSIVLRPRSGAGASAPASAVARLSRCRGTMGVVGRSAPLEPDRHRSMLPARNGAPEPRIARRVPRGTRRARRGQDGLDADRRAGRGAVPARRRRRRVRTRAEHAMLVDTAPTCSRTEEGSVDWTLPIASAFVVVVLLLILYLTVRVVQRVRRGWSSSGSGGRTSALVRARASCS